MVETRHGEITGGSVGASLQRREDAPLLTGQASYTDDHSERGMVHAAVLRSEYGHARILGIDTTGADQLPGVLGVYTAADIEASGIPGQLPAWRLPLTKDDNPVYDLITGTHVPDRPMLAVDRVRFAGEPVAVVVAEDRYVAHEARDSIEVEYERLDAVTDPVTAVSDKAPQLHSGIADNVALEWTVGNEARTAEAFETAAQIVDIDLVNQRVAPCAMEPRCALASFKPSTGELTVTLSTQVPHHHRTFFSDALDIPEHKVTVEAPDVGGGFGLKSKFHPGELIVAWCAMELGRPVKWQETRSASFASDIHGRGHHTHGELAVDEDGRFRGLRIETYVDMGAYLSKVAPFVATCVFGRMLSEQYDFSGVHCRSIAAFTNKAPMDAYRGAGLPEAAYVVERLVKQAAQTLDIDPIELRRRNLIPSSSFPYDNSLGLNYDSGDYEAALGRAIEHLEYDKFRARQRRLRRDDRYVGVGFGCYVEVAAGIDQESSIVRFHPSGKVTAFTGTHDHGQGHGTTYAQILADELGVEANDIEIKEGHTDTAPKGTGTFGSRSAVSAGSALVKSARKVVDQGQRIAAHQLETAVDDIEFDAGSFFVEGAPDRSIHIQEIAGLAYQDRSLPEEVEPGLEASSFVRMPTTYPFGVHAAVVEVDPASGEIDLQQFLAVDDVGVQINPMIVEGQVHGGVAQGIGQALFEEVQYDANGTLVTGSLQDYSVPKATQLPDLEVDSTITPTPTNPLGVKGVGETGTIGSPPAVVNAIVDALEPFGVEHLDMPVTSETVWRAIGRSTSNPSQ